MCLTGIIELEVSNRTPNQIRTDFYRYFQAPNVAVAGTSAVFQFLCVDQEDIIVASHSVQILFLQRWHT